jgi:hypothetical protein
LRFDKTDSFDHRSPTSNFACVQRSSGVFKIVELRPVTPNGWAVVEGARRFISGKMEMQYRTEISGEFARGKIKQRQNGSPVMAPQPHRFAQRNQTKAYEEIP